MHSTLTGTRSATESDVRGACNVRESRVEILVEVVVKDTGLTVVLSDHGDERTDVDGLHLAFVVVVFAGAAQSGGVVDSFLLGLAVVFPLLDGEIVDRGISGSVTPIGTQLVRISLLLCLSARVEFICPGDTSTKVVPVDISVDNDVAEGGPAYPTELADLPDIRLPHVICDVEHHINYNYFYIKAQSQSVTIMYAATKGKNEKITGLDGQMVVLESDFEEMMRKRDEEKRKLELKFKDVYQ